MGLIFVNNNIEFSFAVILLVTGIYFVVSSVKGRLR